jgi:hypothetical protein
MECYENDQIKEKSPGAYKVLVATPEEKKLIRKS